jgi:hypothetical protein
VLSSKMDPDSNIVLEVAGYELVGDCSAAANHLYTVKCWIQQDVFTVTRSFSNFCDLDSRLHRKYPRSNIPECPLTSSLTPKLINAVVHPSNKGGSIKKAESSSEIVRQKQGPLTTYLMGLLDVPEIISSNDLVNFLDVESEDGDEINQSSVSPLEYILRNEASSTVKVLRKRAIPVNLMSGQYIAWRFFTKNKDIGFTIQMDGRDILPYQRYNSHEEIIEGLIQVPLDGEGTIFWDNSYSKVRSKLLTYCYRVIDAATYNEISSMCMDLSRVRHESEGKRNLVRRVLSARSGNLLASSDIRMSMIGGFDQHNSFGG